MANGNENYPDIFDRPIPGQSLTDEPQNYPWEHPAQYSDLREARDRIFDNLSQEENLEQLLVMLASDVPVEALVRTILFAGFTEGKWTVDSAILLAPVILTQIVSLAKASGIEKFRIFLSSFFNLEIFPSDIYFLDKLPSEINLNSILIIFSISIIISAIASYLPAMKISKMSTFRALRYE